MKLLGTSIVLRKQKEISFKQSPFDHWWNIARMTQVVSLLPDQVVDAGDHQRRAFREIMGNLFLFSSSSGSLA